MQSFTNPHRIFPSVIAISLLSASPAAPQFKKIVAAPQTQPVGTTLLLMQGINQPNYLALDQGLRLRPTDERAWHAIVGQAALIAENGNLLMLRPAKKKGQETWMHQAADLREDALKLAETAAKKDYDGCRIALGRLSKTCNRCHQEWRVTVEVSAFSAQPIRIDGRKQITVPLPIMPPAPQAPPLPKVPPIPDPFDP